MVSPLITPEVIQEFKSGDKVSFKLIFDILYPMLVRYVENSFQIKGEYANDIVGDTFYKLFLKREDIKSPDHMQRWMYVITRNQCIDILRAKIKDRQNAKDLLFFQEEVEHQDLFYKEREAAMVEVRKAVERMTGKQRRKIIYLYFFEMKTTWEIVSIMGIRRQTVLNHKIKGLQWLKMDRTLNSTLKFI